MGSSTSRPSGALIGVHLWREMCDVRSELQGCCGGGLRCRCRYWPPLLPAQLPLPQLPALPLPCGAAAAGGRTLSRAES